MKCLVVGRFSEGFRPGLLSAGSPALLGRVFWDTLKGVDPRAQIGRSVVIEAHGTTYPRDSGGMLSLRLRC